MEKLILLQDQVLIITGAGNKVGMETARQALRHGAKVVLVANSEKALQQMSDYINTSGDVVFVQADVSLERDVQRIADTTIRTFGGFDCWINISGEAKFDNDYPEDATGKEIGDTNFWGAVFGSRMAAKFFVESARKGAIVNVDSFITHTDSLNRARHHASQQAVKSWTDGLRIELDKIKANVLVSLILPAPELNLSNSEERGTLLSDEIPAAILYCICNHKREIHVGTQSRFMNLLKGLRPAVINKLMVGATSSDSAFHQERNSLSPGGNSDNAKPNKRFPDLANYYQKASRHPILSTIFLAGIGAGLWMLGRKKR